jgi:exodeoxyribonuclease VII large subunit
MPTISAVGHEIDVTVCDLVADCRAPTPSAAAEAAVRAHAEAATELRALAGRLGVAVDTHLASARTRLAAAAHRTLVTSRRAAELRRARLETLGARLNGVSPLATLGRGYAIARGGDGRVLATVGAFANGHPFELIVRDGRVRARTEGVAHGTPESFAAPTPASGSEHR